MRASFSAGSLYMAGTCNFMDLQVVTRVVHQNVTWCVLQECNQSNLQACLKSVPEDCLTAKGFKECLARIPYGSV